MRYQKFQSEADRKKWLRLETTLGTNEETIRSDIQSFVKLILNMSSEEKIEFSQISDIELDNLIDFEIQDQKTLKLVMLRKFISGISLSIINEALGIDGASEENIYLRLLRRLLNNDEYPENVFAYSIYRSRGTPNTWLSIHSRYEKALIERLVDTSIPKVINKINFHLSLTRRFVGKFKVGELLIYLLSKPTTAKVVRGEKKNVEVQGASYTIIALDLDTKRIGVVTGAKREIGIVQHYLMHKAFDEDLAPPRNDVEADGVKLLNDIVNPSEEDLMLLQSFELRKTALHNNPSLRLKTQGIDTLDEALQAIEEYWSGSSIADMHQIEFGVPVGPVGVYKKLGLYTYGDEWKRTYFNTSSRRVTNLLEQQFLDKISKRLGDNDIKSTRFLLQNLDSRFILDKLLKDKIVSTDPAIPEDVEKMVIRLTKGKLISKQENSIKRKCWNCYAQSWDQWSCPNCGRSDMRIVSEAIKIIPNEAQIMREISLSRDLKDSYSTKYFPAKQRRKHSKPVVSLYNSDKNITTFVMLIANKKDVEYANELSSEGFGLVAVIDPKADAFSQQLEANGATVISLVDIIMLLIGEASSLDLVRAVTDQEREMLVRILSNAKSSLRRISDKVSYDEAKFEVDIKNLMNLLVPDVVRLGTEFTGTSVPDGYLKYGHKGKRSKGRSYRLFGWDAKYSRTASYALGERDVKKQKRYINWLIDKKNQPSKFGALGIYGIIANFDTPNRMDTALNNIAEYRNLNPNTRIVLIQDVLIIKICEWLIDNWQVVIENNSLISDEAFAFFRRKSRTHSYSVSHESDWEKLKVKFEKALEGNRSVQA